MSEEMDMIKWIDAVLAMNIPQSVKALCFNLYEDGPNHWSMEVIGASAFDEEDSDWACEEVTDFCTRDNPFIWEESASWSDVLKGVANRLKLYFTEGSNAEKIKRLDGVGVGFVDGDIEVIYSNS